MNSSPHIAAIEELCLSSYTSWEIHSMYIKIVRRIYTLFCPALGPNNTPSRLWRGLMGTDSIFISNRVLSGAFKRVSKAIFARSLVRYFLFITKKEI